MEHIILEHIMYVIWAIYFLVIILCIFMVTRNSVTVNNRCKIDDAIYAYRCECRNKKVEPKVTYSDKEEYYNTLRRIYDFGCARILPKDKFEIIKPYIK